MKNFFYYFIIFLLQISCVKSPPEAIIENVHIKNVKTEFNNQLSLYFTSNVNLDSLLKNSNAAMKPWLYCPLDGSKDFDIEKMDFKNYFIRGIVKADTIAGKIYNYTVEFDFSKGDTIKGSSTISLSREEIIVLLKDKSCIPCKIYNTFYFTGRKPYFSKQFCIPADEILKALK